jgi:hypothetical protein
VAVTCLLRVWGLGPSRERLHVDYFCTRGSWFYVFAQAVGSASVFGLMGSSSFKELPDAGWRSALSQLHDDYFCK